jgi:uncharacterized caspase-like protein
MLQVAKANTALSVANFNAALAVPAALGLDPSAARSHILISLARIYHQIPFDTVINLLFLHLGTCSISELAPYTFKLVTTIGYAVTLSNSRDNIRVHSSCIYIGEDLSQPRG